MMNNPYALALLEIWGWVSCWFWNIMHNAVAHPLIPFLPRLLSDPIHDWTYKQWNNAKVTRRIRNYHLIDDDF